MGLFSDFQFDPTSYQGSSLIDRLRSQLQPQTAYQNPQGPGFGTPENPLSYGQDRNVAVGNYSMPQFGNAPTANAMDANAQMLPAQTPQERASGQLPAPFAQQIAQPAFLDRPSSGGGFGGAIRGALANAQSGPLGFIGGGIAGAMGMGQGTAQEQQRRMLAQQYQSLVPVLGPQKAMMAVINPEAGKVLIQEALTNKSKYMKIGQDGLGREQYGFVNELDQTINGKPISQQPAPEAGSGLGNMDLTGADYLASLPKPQANTVQMMVEGKIPPPSSFALSKPYWQNMIAAAKNYDPSFDATAWSGRVAGVKDFSAGKSAEMVRSANQTLHHVGALIDSMDALDNGSYPLKNSVGNYLAEATGSGAQGAFRTNAHAVAEELAKVFKGANLSDAEIHAWEKNLHENMSPEQQRTQVAKLNELLIGSLHALEEKRLNSMGPIAAEKAGPLLKEEAQRVLERMNNWIKNKPGSETVAAPKLEVGQSTTINGVTIKKVAK